MFWRGLRIWRARILKLSAVKSVFFTNYIHWCGRLIDKDGSDATQTG